MKKILFLGFIFINTIFSHPHLFIDLSLNLDISKKDKSIKTIQLEWLFDEMNSEIMIMDYDQNSDGIFDKKETAFFKHELFDYLMKEYGYYTLIKSVTKTIELENLFKNIKLSIKKDSKIRNFVITIDLDFSSVKQNNFLEFRFIDESYMTSFKLDKNSIFANIDLENRAFLSKDDEYYGYKLIYVIY
jgi:ABC-type uncharacterized transport system substrate-binding protein